MAQRRAHRPKRKVVPRYDEQEIEETIRFLEEELLRLDAEMRELVDSQPEIWINQTNCRLVPRCLNN